jgi:hypothetical protein
VPFTPAPQELELLNQMRRQNQHVAQNAISIEQTLKEIRSPEWTWTPGYYKQLMRSPQRFSTGQTPLFLR